MFDIVNKGVMGSLNPSISEQRRTMQPIADRITLKHVTHTPDMQAYSKPNNGTGWGNISSLVLNTAKIIPLGTA